MSAEGKFNHKATYSMKLVSDMEFTVTDIGTAMHRHSRSWANWMLNCRYCLTSFVALSVRSSGIDSEIYMHECLSFDLA